MARKSKTLQLTEGIAGQHLALSVAAHLARSQLLPDPLKVYDGQHLTDTLNVVGLALARTAPLHVIDPAAGDRDPQAGRPAGDRAAGGDGQGGRACAWCKRRGGARPFARSGRLARAA